MLPPDIHLVVVTNTSGTAGNGGSGGSNPGGFTGGSYGSGV